jgi:CheY-like chemotaxis protein
VDPHDAVDIGTVIRHLSKLLRRTIGEDLHLEVRLLDEGCKALLDTTSVEQAVLNLVINARDASSPGGTITIETACVDIDAAEARRLATVEPGRFVRLRVSDDGAGMKPDVLRRAFDPFFTTKDRGRGTGLGLATIYGMVQSSGGHIAIESTVGEGTRVTLLLPEAPETVEPTVTTVVADSAPQIGARVLLVEDEPAVRTAQRRMLERAGYDVVEAADGAAAIDRFVEAPIDLLISDLVMPGPMSGADVAERLRRDRPELHALFVTGYGGDLLRARGIKVDGATSAVLEKPFSEQELLAAVAGTLAGRA